MDDITAELSHKGLHVISLSGTFLLPVLPKLTETHF